MPAVRELAQVLAQLQPELDATTWVFVALSGPVPDGLAPLMTFAEDEGTTVVVPQDTARQHALPDEQPMGRIVLRVHSALDGVGLTAAVSGALAAHGISCNVVAAYHHDHLFVPVADAARALLLLQELQARG